MTPIHTDVLDTILDYVHEMPAEDAVFPRSYEIDAEWRAAWLRKLNRAAQWSADDLRLDIRRGHRLSWKAPALLQRQRRPFYGIDFLLETQPHLRAVTRREGSDTLLCLQPLSLDARFLDGHVVLDGTMRLMPALDLAPLLWHRVHCPCELDLETEDPIRVTLIDSGEVVDVPRFFFPFWDFECHYVPAGSLVQGRHELEGVLPADVGVFRDPFTVLLREAVVLPSYLEAKRAEVPRRSSPADETRGASASFASPSWSAT